MQLRLIHYNHELDKTSFALSEGKRPWHILLILCKGAISATFQERGEHVRIGEGEIAFFPANTAFTRAVDAPIDFHQFAFLCNDEHPICRALHAGRLDLPATQTVAVCNTLARVAAHPEHRALLLHVLEHLLTEQYLFSKNAATPVHVSDDVRFATQYLADHLSEHVDMRALAARVYLSQTGLIRKFRRELDTTPSQYLIMLRLREGKRLLLEGALPIGEVARRCGYAGAYYFTNAFRSYTGMSPTAFRRHYLQEERQT